MREIKFRSWHTAKKRIFPHENLIVSIKNIGDDNIWKFMQFTGLLDKNKKEIYEGDILKDVHFGYNTKVVYEGNQFVSESNVGYVGLFETENYEVIGNIYENQELLNP